jgi:hypothetical protein
VVPAPAGFAYDVLVTDPCDGDPVIDWQPNVSNPSDTFIPTTGPGTYTFQARLVNTGNGHTTGYTAVHIDVTGGPPGSGCPTTGPTPTGSPS